LNSLTECTTDLFQLVAHRIGLPEFKMTQNVLVTLVFVDQPQYLESVSRDQLLALLPELS